MSTPLLHLSGRVLAAIDPSEYAASIADHAAWAATRLGSGLRFVHALARSPKPATVDMSGNLALGETDALMQELASIDEQRGRVSQSRGRLLLDHVQTRVKSLGVDASVILRHGEVVDSLLELESDVRLFVIGKRGEHADFAAGHLGSNLERVVRAVHRPVLVAPRHFNPIARFMIAFDGSATTRKCVEVVCASPLLKGLACDLLLVGEDSEANREHMAWAKMRLREAGFDPAARYVEGNPDEVIVEIAHEQHMDLIVMGAYGHSRIRQLVVGSTTTHVL